MLQKLFVSYQLRADPLRKEWLLAAPALQKPAIAGLSRCAKDQTTAADTHPARRPCWAWPSLGEGHGPHGTPGQPGCRPGAVWQQGCRSLGRAGDALAHPAPLCPVLAAGFGASLCRARGMRGARTPAALRRGTPSVRPQARGSVAAQHFGQPAGWRRREVGQRFCKLGPEMRPELPAPLFQASPVAPSA